MTDYKAEWLKEFDKLARRTDFWQAFKDWCGLFAIEISTRVDLTQPKDRLKEYATIARRYDKEEKLSMAKMAALLVTELDERVTTEGYQDVLGEIFHELDVQNKYKAQFFTPNCLSEMMGRLAIGDDIKETLKTQPFVTMNDAACGSGSTIYGWQYAVRPGLGGDIFKAFYRKPGKSWHAVRVLAWFASEQEAEADLERWAAKKHMRCMEG